MKRLAIYFFYDNKGIIREYNLSYIRALKAVSSEVWVVSNGVVTEASLKKLLNITKKIYIRENTGFDVWAYPESKEIKATLEQGTVQVHLNEVADRIYQLKPDEQLVYHVDKKEVDVRKVVSSDYSDWRNGGLFFDNVSFREVVRTIERSYGVTVHLHTSIYNDNQLTIHFKKNESLENVFMLLKELIPGLEFPIFMMK